MKLPKFPVFDKVTGISLLLAPLAYMVVYAVLFTDRYTEQLQTVVVTAILAKLLPDMASYWFDSNAREAKKAEDQAKQPTPQVDVPAQTIDVARPDADAKA